MKKNDKDQAVKRLAMQIIVQLPANMTEALTVLAITKAILEQVERLPLN